MNYKINKVMVVDIMAFDFKKEYEEFYMPKNKPQIVDVPKKKYTRKMENSNQTSH